MYINKSIKKNVYPKDMHMQEIVTAFIGTHNLMSGNVHTLFTPRILR